MPAAAKRSRITLRPVESVSDCAFMSRREPGTACSTRAHSSTDRAPILVALLKLPKVIGCDASGMAGSGALVGAV